MFGIGTISHINPFKGKRIAAFGSFVFVLILIGWSVFLQPVDGVKGNEFGVQTAFSMEEGGPLNNNFDGAIISYIHPSSFDSEREMSMVTHSGAVLSSSDPLNESISTDNGLRKYRIREGDTLTGIAVRFGITVDTVRWANSGVRTVLVPGRELIIPPVSGVIHEVQENETIDDVADLYQINPEDIRKNNPEYQEILATSRGTLIIPNARPVNPLSMETGPVGLPDLGDYFMLPAVGWNWGVLHRYNAVDIANECGTPVYAAAEGLVIPDEVLGNGSSGWNNGYGLFILIEHPNGTRTRYAHLEKALVEIGDYVSQGDEIAQIGNTGNTHGPTGCHLHFEVYGARNPFAIR